MKTIIVILLFAIIVALFTGFYFLMKDGDRNSKRVVTALTWRVRLQVILILLLVVAFFMGWIQPHGVYYETQESAPQQTEAGQ